MENTFQNKATFFAQYWGQRLMAVTVNEDQTRYKVGNSHMGKYHVECCHLEEKSGWISMKHKQKIISVDIDLDGSVFEYHDDESYLRPSLAASGTDFLRSQGYAMPWMVLSVEKQIEFGWLKLKKN